MKTEMLRIVEHKATGALIPVVVREIDYEGIVTNYYEKPDNRKYFTIEMINKRWSKVPTNVFDILKKYEVPGYIATLKVPLTGSPLNVAMFFEEYIYAIEKKLELPHKKVKPKLYKDKVNV